MQAPDRPRRPIRRMQRTRPSCRASARTTSQVSSGELSSTKTTSQATPSRAASSLRNSFVTLSRSLKVGTTTESTGKAVACFAVSSPGRIASFIGKRISAASDRAKAKFRVSRPIVGEKGENQPQKCQRPRTTGARTSGAALPFRGRTGAGALWEHRRRR